MKRNCFQVTLLLSVILMSLLPAYGESITIVTEEFPPYSYSDNGKITGIGTETVFAVLNDLKIKPEIKIYPWARAYKMALSQKNVLIFTISRTQQRENLFKWVGPVAPSSVALFSLQKRDDMTINSLNDAKKYKIGAVREDARTQYLLSKDFTRIDQVTNDTQNLKKLLANRIDLWLVDELTAYYMIKENGYANKIFKKVYGFQISSGAYMAFSKSTSDELVETFRKSLENIKIDGTYAKIVEKYK